LWGVWEPLEEQDGNPYEGYYEPRRKSGVVQRLDRGRQPCRETREVVGGSSQVWSALQVRLANLADYEPERKSDVVRRLDRGR
jgi:hypothetical protein